MGGPTPRKKKRERRGGKRVADQHGHGDEVVLPPAPFGGRRPNPESIITVLNQRLDQRKEEVRALEDREAFNVALINDLIAQTEAQAAMLQQVQAENMILRKRLKLPTAGALELTDAEAAEAAGAGADVTESDEPPGEAAAAEAGAGGEAPVPTPESPETAVPDEVQPEPESEPGPEPRGEQAAEVEAGS